MPEMRWHKVCIVCTKCKKEPTIVAISSSADGEILVDLFCLHCDSQLRWVSNTLKLMATALYSDMEEAMVKGTPPKKANQPIRPPIIKAEDKKKDDDWLRDLGIDPKGIQ